MTFAIAGALGGVWIYLDDFQNLRLRLVNRDAGTTPLRAEQWIVLTLIVATVAIPAYVWIWQAWPKIPSARHLTTEQKALMRPISMAPRTM